MARSQNLNSPLSGLHLPIDIKELMVAPMALDHKVHYIKLTYHLLRLGDFMLADFLHRDYPIKHNIP